MAGIKRKYNVYRVTRTFDGITGESQEYREHVGDTWAVSAAKAESNIAYRLSGGKTYYHADWAGDGGRDSYYEAVLADGAV